MTSAGAGKPSEGMPPLEANMLQFAVGFVLGVFVGIILYIIATFIAEDEHEKHTRK